MTQRQIHLVRAEVLRHVKLAESSYEPEIHRGHMEVAAALSAALEGESKLCIPSSSTPVRLYRKAIRTVSGLLHLPTRTLAADACGSEQSPVR